jgi:3-phytase
MGNPAYDTAAFTGGLRVDYVLPSNNLAIANANIFWPVDSNPLSSLNNASDHHAVFLDVAPVPEPTGVLGILAGIGVLFVSRKRNFNS